MNKHLGLRRYPFLLLALLTAFSLALAACGPQTQPTSAPEHQDEQGDHDMDMEGGDEEHDAEHDEEHSDADRIPNDGAEIHILAPADGALISGGEVVVEVEVLNFELDDDGSHWHVYVDGVSHGMVLGHDFDQALRGLEPGEHTVEVYLALGTHEELEEGDSITVIVEE